MSDRIVALHGFLGQGRDWDAVRAATKTPLDWFCPDLFASAGPEWTPPELGGRAWLIGYSFGARLALRWLAERPELWRGAVLLSVNPGNFFTDEERAARRESDRAWAHALRELSWEELLSRWNAQNVFAGARAPERMEKDFNRARLALAMERFSAADQFTEPSRLPSSLVWLAGENDHKFCRLQEEVRLAGFPGSFFTVHGAGHRILFDTPEVVASTLDRVVSGKP